jgi:hypothetical protein
MKYEMFLYDLIGFLCIIGVPLMFLFASREGASPSANLSERGAGGLRKCAHLLSAKQNP